MSASHSEAVQWEIISDGTFALDGGAMFGIVPRPLWEKVMPPDASNRVRLGLNCLVVRSGGRILVVDTGVGDKGDDRFRSRYAVDGGGLLRDRLRARGVRPEDVTDVVNSHLHWDHAGGNTYRRPGGELEPAFPNATYYVQRREVEFARSATARTRGSYEPQDYEPLLSGARIVVLDGEAEIAPGVQVHPAAGHLPAMQVVTVNGPTDSLFFAADLIPTTRHLNPAWIMAYDVEPLLTQEVKVSWLERAASGGWIVVFYHDPDCPLGVVEAREGRWTVIPRREG
jgi:glyoxylase-like metal-dependent hydrolase (beta-lactamase superfamily II)